MYFHAGLLAMGSTMRLSAFVFVLVMVIKLQPAESNAASEVLGGVYQKMAALSNSLISDMQEFFYKYRTPALSIEDYTLLFLATSIAESESILCAFQRRGLLVVEMIIKKYFIDKTEPLDRVLVRSRCLLELIATRAFVLSLERGLSAIERHRKEICLVQLKYESTYPSVMDLTRKYLKLRTNDAWKLDAVNQNFDQTLSRYKDIVPLRLSGIPVADMDVDISETLRVIDQMITTTEMSIGGPMPIDVLLKTYTDPKLHLDIKYSIFLCNGNADRPSAQVVDTLPMAQVLRYEEKIIQETTALDNYLRQIDLRAAELDERFNQFLQEIFYNVYNAALVNNNYPVMALSAQMAEMEALLHASEKRMLDIIRSDLDHNADYSHIIATNSRAIDMLVLRLIARAAANGFKIIELRRKKLYMVMRRYEEYYGVRDLATKYARHMNSRQTALVSTVSKIRELVHDYRRDVPEAQANHVFATVDRLAEAEASKWNFGWDEYYLLRQHLNQTTFDQIRTACQKSSNKVHRPRGDLVVANTMEQILQYEANLLEDQSD